MFMYIYSRAQVNRLVQIILDRYDMRIIAITGPRQVGKTVIALQAYERLIELGYTCKYVSFDDPRLIKQEWPKSEIIPDTTQIKDLTNPKTLIDLWEEARKDSIESTKGHVLFLMKSI